MQEKLHAQLASRELNLAHILVLRLCYSGCGPQNATAASVMLAFLLYCSDSTSHGA